ncbi:HEAT repeat domain-containing protein [Roseiflexus sp. RS-1]|uniref:HEAT repeat domain-containing protein n=1 Tax=Roseiflexus sp. (strain RS-1) TaxID=357808 RepID=UPI0000D806B2|nr:HEAT repeat domain-containing protein [Roseiflexus sp. RS-1]ABQ89921.1 PBS lyase HEAT domain protein repeat-containing protein [Roseiflexus sp. RS-1]
MITIDPLRWLKRRRATPVAPHHHDALVGRARDIGLTGRWEMLDNLPAPDRDAVAVRLAVQVDDPLPLFRWLWRRAAIAPDHLLTLARCLRAVSDSGMLWPIRVGTALAEGRAGDIATGPVLQALLDCLPALDAALDRIVQRKRSPVRVLQRLFRALPLDLATPRLSRLAFDEATPAPLAWTAADWLVERLSATDPLDAPPATPASRLRWIYVEALRGGAGLQTLEVSEVRAALAAFADSAAGAARCERLGSAVLTNTALAPTVRLAALDLVVQQEAPPWTQIVALCSDENEAVRRGALARIGACSGREAIATLVRLALNVGAPGDVRFEAVMRLSVEARWDIAPVLQRCAIDGSLPLAAQLRAAAALARRSVNLPRMLAIIRDPQVRVEVRAAAARAAAFPTMAPHFFRLMLDSATPPPVLIGMCQALATPACRTAAQRGRLILIRLLNAARADVSLTLTIIRALGAIGGDEAVSALAPLAGRSAIERLQSVVPSDALDLPVGICLEQALIPPPMITRLRCALACAPTIAEQPTTLAQFLVNEANLVRCAAIEALTVCGGARAREAILIALRHPAAPAVAAALAVSLDTSGSSHDLLKVFADAGIDPTIRWHIVDRLAQRADGPALLRDAWTQRDLDAYGRELIIDALTRYDAGASASFLVRLASDADLAPVVRERALAALEGVTDAAFEEALVQLIGDGHLDPGLRGKAAASLPVSLTPATRAMLRDLVRTDPPPTPLLIGVLRALGRCRDAAALPIFLRYILDEHTEVAQAAIEALAACGDSSITPALVRVALSPQAGAATKLNAVEALVRLGDQDAVRLLRPYLSHRSIILQMRAFRLLAETAQIGGEAERLARDRLCPAPLRLAALNHLSAGSSSESLLAALVGDSGEDPTIRAAAASRLHAPGHVSTLVGVALDATAPMIVRSACIASLGACNATDAWLALSTLASCEEEPTIRELALHELEHLTVEPLSDRVNYGAQKRHDHDRR